MTADTHGDTLAHPSPYHVSNCCSAQVVEDQTFAFQVVAGPITSIKQFLQDSFEVAGLNVVPF